MIRTSMIALVWGLAVFACGLTMPNRADASSLEDSLDTLAKEVIQYLTEKGIAKISVETFDGPRSGTGRLIANKLIEKLKANPGIAVVDGIDAQVQLRGRFSVNVGTSLPFVLLETGLFDSVTGSESKEFRQRITEAFDEALAETAGAIKKADAVDGKTDVPAEAKPTSGIPIDNPKDVGTIAAPTVDLTKAIEKAVPPGTKIEQVSTEVREKALDNRNKALQESLKKPAFASVTETIVAPAQDSPFRMQISVADSFSGPFEPFPILNRDGLAFSPFKEGQFYSVTIINQADFDVGVELTIDGINTLSFSEIPAFRESGKWVIPAGQAGTIRGFHVNNRFVDSFQVVAVPQGAIEEKLADPTRIGTITAAFHAAWKEGETPPKAAKIVGIPADLKTVRGPRIEAQSQSVTRVFCETALAFMSVRYVNPEPPSDLPVQ